MPYLTIDQGSREPMRLYYQDSGQGRPVVLIHGWPLSHRMWEAQVNALTEAGYRCIAYDRRGFGESDKPWEGYDYDTLAADLHALMEALDLREATIAGFSMGGGEVARYLGRYGSQRVSQAMLLGAVPPFLLKTEDNPEGVDWSVFQGMLDGVRADRPAFLEGFLRTFFNWDAAKPSPSEAMLRYCETIAQFASPRGTQQCIVAFGKTDFREDLKKIDVPTLVVHGDADAIVPLALSGQKSHEMVAGSRLEVIPGGPHGFNATHAARLNELMLEFLRS